MNKIRLATRKSKLALIQSAMVQKALEEKGYEVEIVTVTTKGDKNQKDPLHKIGGTGVFVKEIENTLKKDEADIAVHSAKDLPGEVPEGFVIPGVLPAAEENDVLIYKKDLLLSEVNVIGSGSPRRICELQALVPDRKLDFRPIRGNVDTRLQKLRDGEYDGIILAKAGLQRLKVDLSDFNIKEFSYTEIIPAAGQGIIALECLTNHEKAVEAARAISHEASYERFVKERELLNLFHADCSEAIGFYYGSKEVCGMYEGRRTIVKRQDFSKEEMYRFLSGETDE